MLKEFAEISYLSKVALVKVVNKFVSESGQRNKILNKEKPEIRLNLKPLK